MELDTTKEALDVTKYDLVYILLKCKNEIYKDFLKYDKSKKRYYVAGIIVDIPGNHYNSIQFVEEKHIKDYRKAKKFEDKKKL